MKILVVEDNADALQVVCDLFGLLGHAATAAADAEQAWELLRRQEFDVLFTDISLPGMSGLALARQARCLRPGLRVIFSSGYGSDWPDSGIGFPAAVLRKPYDLAELQAALARRE